MPDTSSSRSRKQIRAVALPAEHGGWGFLFEPVTLGLLLEASWAGLFLAVSTIAVFLMRQPLKLAMIDWRKGRRFERTQLSEKFVLIYGIVATLTFVLALGLVGTVFLLPLGIALPLALIQVVSDYKGASRDLLPELTGATAMAASASVIMLAGGWALTDSLVVWTVLAARTIPSILYVRARLRLERGQSPSRLPSTVSHLAALTGVFLLAVGGYCPVSAVGVMLVLLVRAVHGLSEYRKPSPAKVIGFQEVGFGILLVLGYWVGWVFGF